MVIVRIYPNLKKACWIINTMWSWLRSKKKARSRNSNLINIEAVTFNSRVTWSSFKQVKRGRRKDKVKEPRSCSIKQEAIIKCWSHHESKRRAIIKTWQSLRIP